MSSFSLLIALRCDRLSGNSISERATLPPQKIYSDKRFSRGYSDYFEPDDIGRSLDMNICGKFVIKFWIDDPDKHLKVLDVHNAD